MRPELYLEEDGHYSSSGGEKHSFPPHSVLISTGNCTSNTAAVVIPDLSLVFDVNGQFLHTDQKQFSFWRDADSC